MLDKDNWEKVLFETNIRFSEAESFRSLTISAVRMLKKPRAIELKRVKFWRMIYLKEIVLKTMLRIVESARMKRNVEKYNPH